ncbi:sensor histidine kinase [filamentous cyanobacterium LEGE 11480]|uniref:histidine kinase n=1 Tax=Romeriopsis navalis LEGE 11480 TaxID=2777977 RepID=A0A928VRL4_9CYAN|nr:sensor histidine kinase [Romeriopsis navalis LEGE 11480]
MPASAEFVDLCQSQLWLLVQTLGASVSVVYLTEEVASTAETRLVRIASAPDGAAMPGGEGGTALSPVADVGRSSESPQSTELADPKSSTMASSTAVPIAPLPSPDMVPERLVVPLIHEEIVLGLLVTERNDRRWQVRERQQIEQIVQTLSLACVLDKRSQWLQQRQAQQAQLQAQQHDVMDNLVHQFRNPLTALRTFGKLLLKRLPEDDRNYVAASSIVRESDRLQELLLQIDRAIDLTESFPDEVKVTTPAALPSAGPLGEAQLALKPCDVGQILQPLVVSASAVAQEKQLVLHAELPDVIPLVQADQSALREVLSNLIDNAVKYTPAGGEVHVRLQVLGKQLVVRVTDNGAGIPDTDLPQLFQRHFRGVQDQTEIPGTGLGLAIARELVQQMQGDIQVFSPMQPEGWLGEYLPAERGVTFVVALPTLS